MSIVAISMNVLLGVLLVAAMVFGWRLERQLKRLRDGHENFAKAVGELDVAAARAQAGLATLREATQEAEAHLAARIEAAQALADHLDKAVLERPRRPASTVAPSREDDWLDRPLPQVRERPLPARFEPQTTARSRARIDDDLFEPEALPGRLRAIPGGRS
jgi:hypothetical protein